FTAPFKIAAKATETAAKVAQKAQQVATQVALKSARMAAKMTQKATELSQKAAGIQAKAAARASARAHARALKALPRRPGVYFLREVRHGQTSVAFYRQIDHRAGRVSEFFTLNRDTPGGRVRLASGSMSEFQSLRTIANRSLRPSVQTRQGP